VYDHSERNYVTDMRINHVHMESKHDYKFEREREKRAVMEYMSMQMKS